MLRWDSCVVPGVDQTECERSHAAVNDSLDPDTQTRLGQERVTGLAV